MSTFSIKTDSMRIKGGIEIYSSSVMDFSLYDFQTSVQSGKKATFFDSEGIGLKSEILF